MQTRTYFIENPYEARLIAEPIELTFKCGKEKRRERRKKARK
jgi:hypothetical protein